MGGLLSYCCIYCIPHSKSVSCAEKSRRMIDLLSENHRAFRVSKKLENVLLHLQSVKNTLKNFCGNATESLMSQVGVKVSPNFANKPLFMDGPTWTLSLAS